MISVGTEFTPLTSLLGGGLIGIASVWLLLSTGKIAGISGIVSRLLAPITSAQLIGVAFVAGLLFAPILFQLVTGYLPDQSVSSNYTLLAVAGVLVGFGSVLGSGCTSGHGVCGISRLSQRSLVATSVFMIAAFITVFLLQQVLGV